MAFSFFADEVSRTACPTNSWFGLLKRCCGSERPTPKIFSSTKTKCDGLARLSAGLPPMGDFAGEDITALLFGDGIDERIFLMDDDHKCIPTSGN